MHKNPLTTILHYMLPNRDNRVYYSYMHGVVQAFVNIEMPCNINSDNHLLYNDHLEILEQRISYYMC